MSIVVPGGSVSGGRPIQLAAVPGPFVEVAPPSPAMLSRPVYSAAPLPNFTAGVPAPHTITQQKDEHVRSLEMQLKQGMETLGVEHKQQTDSVREQAEHQIRGFQLSVEQQVKRAELALNQRYSEKMMLMQQAAEAQRADIECQAAALMLQFNQCKTQDDFLQQNQTIEGQHAQMQAKLAADIQALGPPLRMTSGPTPPRPAVAVYRPPSLPGTPKTSFVPAVALPGTPQGPFVPPVPLVSQQAPQRVPLSYVPQRVPQRSIRH